MDEFLKWIVPIIAVFIAFHNNRENHKLPIKRERYEKLIFPIFNIIEPYLYKYEKIYPKKDIINEINKLIGEHKYLAGFGLINCIQNYRNEKTKTNYNKLCDYISEELDYLSAYLGISKRSHKYKVSREQFVSRKALHWANLKYYLYLIFLNISMIILVVSIILIYIYLLFA